MGNHVSCAPSVASSKKIKVLHSNGRFEEYSRPLKVAELMLENPGNFVCDSQCFKVAHRVVALAADEDMEPRRLYYLLPMNMLYSVLSAAEFGSLTQLASKAMKSNGGSKKLGAMIFPAFGESCMFQSNHVKTSTLSVANDMPHAGVVVRPFCRQRSWQPALATILETPLSG